LTSYTFKDVQVYYYEPWLGTVDDSWYCCILWSSSWKA